jgi:hypothetical protein
MTSHFAIAPVKAAVVGATVTTRLITTIHAVTIIKIRGHLEGLSDAYCLRAATDAPNYCQACQEFYGREYVSPNWICSGNIHNNNGNLGCLSTDGLKQYYFEQIQCKSKLACRDGYMHLGRCVSKCPPGYYGQANYPSALTL